MRVGGKVKVEAERESPAGDRARGVVCERGPVSRLKPANECKFEARQRARGRKEWRGSVSDGEGEAKAENDESKIKIEK